MKHSIRHIQWNYYQGTGRGKSIFVLLRECAECGSEFTPYERHERFCSTSCYCAYNGFPDQEEE